ncbi:ABC transporter ATP-binding protein [Spirochaetia bacterium 38H-sp]|uniref:ABC transporter ATP-binding protein n=1 Tax=Rarispira pelagica TaxID=3141764 RepID=A0ABU9UD99_9SPIR
MGAAVEFIDIVKDFPGVRANDHVSFVVEEGSVHAILGENGAGKSTLMSVLFGLYRPDAGHIRVKGRDVVIANPNVATSLGIGMVHQHFKLVHNFTVTQNIVLGMEPRRMGLLDISAARTRVVELSEAYGLAVDPDAVIEDISVGMQQRVEILKMLYRDADILVFDEPTAVLTPQEIDELMDIIKKLAASGKTVLLITHKLKEIKAVAKRCTVLRRGRVIDTFFVSDVSESDMAKMMVGREVSFSVDKEESSPGAVRLEIDNLRVKDERGVFAVDGLSLYVRAGEIVGLCGVDGNGQRELVYALAGLLPVEYGSIRLNGTEISKLPVIERLNAGIGFIPEDRQKHGLVLDFRIDENMVLHDYNRRPFSLYGILQPDEMYRHAEKLMQEFDVRAGEGPASLAANLSGGNQQKAILAREINRSPSVLVVVQPTRGLDVGAIEYIHSRIVAERDKGRAILLVSFELDEVMDLSDRIAVIHNGHIVGIVSASETNANELGLMMSGSTIKEKTV